MLTPAFQLTQNESSLIIIITAKYSKIADTEIFFEENDFKFYSKPYFLRLNLPGKVKSMDDVSECETVSYNVDTGEFTIKLEKETHGEVFEGLDLITKLLTPAKKMNQPTIEVLDDDTNEEEIEDFDWQIDQKPFEDDAASSLLSQNKYGFANLYSGILTKFQDEGVLDLDVTDPDSKSFAQRHSDRIERELRDFSEEHYLADYFEDDHIKPLLNYESSWRHILKKLKKDSTLCVDDLIDFTEKEIEIMRKLPKRKHLLNAFESRCAIFGLIDIIFSFAYQERATEGETNVESAWMITKLNPTLSSMDIHDSIQSVIDSCVRRVLCYPLFRNFNLAKAVLKDTKQIFQLGRKQLLKCLAAVYSIFTDSDGHYVLNNLYVIDYMIWIQHISNEKLDSIADALKNIKVNKKNLGLDLEELEAAGKLVSREEELNLNVSQNNAGASGCEQTREPENSMETLCGEMQHLKMLDPYETHYDVILERQDRLDSDDDLPGLPRGIYGYTFDRIKM